MLAIHGVGGGSGRAIFAPDEREAVLEDWWNLLTMASRITIGDVSGRWEGTRPRDYADVNGVRTRPDLFVELPNGQQAFIEVKTGPGAGLTTNHGLGFPGIRSGGAVPMGENAAAAGLTVGQPLPPTPVWVVRMPWPLGG